MNKKGFTLVEILAVLVILGILAVLLVPTVKNLISDSEDALSKQQISTIIAGAKKYMVENSDLLPDINDESATVIHISDLVSHGVLQSEKVINPKTNQNIDGCVVVSYSSSYNQYEYSYHDSNELVCSE